MLVLAKLLFSLSRKRIVDNAILAFKFQQNWLGNISMCFARLVASRCVLEHGVGSGWSGSHDALVKFPNYAFNMLTMIVTLCP